MSESNDAPPPPPPPEEPDGSPFPESSLTPPPLPPQEEPPPAFEVPTPLPAPPEPAPLEPAPPEPAPPAPVAEPPARPWMESAPVAPPQPPAPPAPAGGAGLLSGDPLAGSAPAPPPPAFPPGYTSPAPPGAGGGYAAPPPAQTFGSTSPVAGQYVLAGWWRRVGAAIIDGIIILVVAFVIMTPLGIGIFSSDPEADGGFIALILGFIVAGLVIAVVALAYAPVMMGKTNGKTLGRMATGIRVVRADGQAITIGFAAVREVAVKTLLIGTIGGAVTFGLASLLDVLWPLWDDENRALHDFVVNTRTVMDG